MPEPRATGPFDVVVKIGGAGVCRTDLHIIEEQWAEKSGVTLPYTIGHENAGWVHEVGPAVTNVEVGDTVILHPTPTCGLCHACRAGDDMHCPNGSFPGIDSDGGMAEYLLTSARACIKLDPATQPERRRRARRRGHHRLPRGAQGRPAAVPGHHLRRQRRRWPRAHRHPVAQGRSTATRVIVVDRNADALELAATLGADETVLADGKQVDAVLDLTGGNGAEVVLDFVAEQGAQQDAFAMTRRAGSHFVIGYGSNIDIPTIDIISTERNVIGNLVGTYNDLVELMVLAQAGKVTLHTKKYPLDAALDALADLDAGRVRGRAILTP